MGRIPLGGEPRSERIAVLLTTKTKEALTKVAMVQRSSMNAVINSAVDKYLADHKNDIDRYDAFFGEATME